MIGLAVTAPNPPLTVISGENPGSKENPKIPWVCKEEGVPHNNFLGLIKAEGWKLGGSPLPRRKGLKMGAIEKIAEWIEGRAREANIEIWEGDDWWQLSRMRARYSRSGLKTCRAWSPSGKCIRP